MRDRIVARGADAGFAIVQVVAALGLVMAVLGIGLGGRSQSLANVQGDTSLDIVLWQLKLARESAINQRRAVEVQFTTPNFMTVRRHEIPKGTTVISTAVLEHGSEFHLFPTMPDTPDGYGRRTAIDFGGVAVVLFTAAGQVTNPAGNLLNGTIFVGQPGKPLTARALTVSGRTAAIRTFTWNGSAWSRQDGTRARARTNVGDQKIARIR